MHTRHVDVAAREREFVRVAGPDAADYLQRMVSNDVEALGVGEACPALLLTAKARVIAPLVVLRRSDEDFLLLTEPGLGEAVRGELLRLRFRAQCEIEPEEHEAALVFGGADGFATDWPGAREVLDAGLAPTLSADELELRRIS
jgi:tRNA-modifying protein YgfZ